MLALILWGAVGVIALTSKRIDKITYLLTWSCLMLQLIEKCLK